MPDTFYRTYLGRILASVEVSAGGCPSAKATGLFRVRGRRNPFPRPVRTSPAGPSGRQRRRSVAETGVAFLTPSATTEDYGRLHLLAERRFGNLIVMRLLLGDVRLPPRCRPKLQVILHPH